VLSGFASDLRAVRRKLFKNFNKRMEIVFFQGPRFLGGSRRIQKSIEDEPRSGKPSTAKNDENIVRVRDLVRSDRRLTVRTMGEQLGSTQATVHRILTNDLEMRKICAKMVPKNLSINQFLTIKNIPVSPQPLLLTRLKLI